MTCHWRFGWMVAVASALVCPQPLEKSADAQSTPPRQGTAAAPKPPNSVKRLEDVNWAVVRILTPSSQGSGFVYRSAGYILTNRHVVEPLAVGEIVQVQGVQVTKEGVAVLKEPVEGTIRYKHPRLDMAVIQVHPSHARTYFVPKYGIDELAPLTLEVYAHGFPGSGGAPRGDALTKSKGIISAHIEDHVSGSTWYQSDVGIDHGSSGGPVTDSRGLVIGLATRGERSDGTGPAWSYILPLKTIDAELQTGRGFDGLPAPFIPSKWTELIRNSKTISDAARHFRDGVERAIRATGSARELSIAIRPLWEAMLATRTESIMSSVLSAQEVLADTQRTVLTRLFELQILEDEEAFTDGGPLCAAATRVWSDELTAAAMDRAIDGVTGERLVQALSDRLSRTATLVSTLVVDGGDGCEGVASALNDLRSSGPSKANRKRYAAATATLVLARLMLDVVETNPDLEDDQDIPLAIRRAARVSNAAMANAIDSWAALPEACRKLAEQEVGKLRSLVAPTPATETAGPSPSPPQTTFTAVQAKALLIAYGWIERVASEDLRAVGGKAVLELPPSLVTVMMCIVVEAVDVQPLAFSVEAGGRALPAAGSETRAGMAIAFFEVPPGAATLTVTGLPGSRSGARASVLTRPSTLDLARLQARVIDPRTTDAAVLVRFSIGRDRIPFNPAAEGLSQFSAHIIGLRGADHGLRVVDPTGKVVGEVPADSPFPFIEVGIVVPGEYSIEFAASEEGPACVDVLLSGVSRTAPPLPAAD